MIQKPIENINRDDLLLLVNDSVLEKKTLDYKEKFSGNSDSDKREFLKDITSFANSSGGDIIYGIKEENGVPAEIIGIYNEEIDSKIRWIEDLVRQGVQPRIPGIKIQPIDVADNKKALVIRIPKSWRSPHCVTFQNWSRFFARSSNGVYQLDVDELRSAFVLSESLSEKIQNFKNDRIANIVAGETLLRLNTKSNIVLQIVPISAFNIKAEKIDIKSVFNNQFFNTIYYGASRKRINFEGMILYSEAIEAGKVDAYTQLYKNGIIEAVESSLLSSADESQKFIPYVAFEEALIKSTKQYIDFLKEVKVELPYFIFITLTGVKGYEMPKSFNFYRGIEYKIDREILSSEVIILEDFNTEIDLLLRPVFDSIWNACGYTQSINYDENGRFNPKKY
ncbi:MAG: ATP-binding protein [Bacillota bacterium]|nr:ATP-binding protein [Bacillota bacterium]